MSVDTNTPSGDSKNLLLENTDKFETVYIGFSKDNQISRDDNNIGSSLTVVTEEIGRTGQIDINTPVVSVPIVGATTREQYNAAKENIKKKAELSKLAKLEKDSEREEDSPEK